MSRVRRYYVGFVVALPPGVRTILSLTCGTYLFQLVTAHRWDSVFGLVPRMVLEGALWQLLTYALLHASFLHLLWNMLVLWMFGSELEAVWGSRRLSSYYALCVLGGGVLTVATSLGEDTVTVGASGGIFGLLTAFGVLFPDRPLAVMFLFPVRAKYFVLVLAGLQLLFFARGPAGIAYAAHLGGLAAGLIFMMVTRRKVPFVGQRQRTKRPRLVVIPKPHQEETEEVAPEEIDRILDKISSSGLGALTDREREILRRASKALNRREDDDS